MILISIIGSGNVAQHLLKVIAKTVGLELVQIVVRETQSVLNLISEDKICTNYNEIKLADLYLVAVSDDAIALVSAKLPFENRLVVHTSGSVSITNLDSKNRKGVFYPLQTFSKNKEVNFKSIPICLESEIELDRAILEKVANLISEKVYLINSLQRNALHIAAVFVCNFTNHLYKLGNDICNENQIPFEILNPLIEETANKIQFLSPKEAQTGPAKREDIQTINKHLNFLSNQDQKDIYKILTKSIIDNG